MEKLKSISALAIGYTLFMYLIMHFVLGYTEDLNMISIKHLAFWTIGGFIFVSIRYFYTRSSDTKSLVNPNSKINLILKNGMLMGATIFLIMYVIDSYLSGEILKYFPILKLVIPFLIGIVLSYIFEKVSE